MKRHRRGDGRDQQVREDSEQKSTTPVAIPGKAPPLDRLLFTREQVAALLGGVSIATIRRLEQRGQLHPVRLTPRTGQVFHRAEDVQRLIDQAEDAID
jgi:hypothetical protein